MVRGTAFLKSQVNHAVTRHEAFLNALEDHEEQAEDPRFRDSSSVRKASTAARADQPRSS